MNHSTKVTLEIQQLLSTTEVLVFDFDGPLCDVFPRGANEQLMASFAKSCPDQAGTGDPFSILRKTRVDDGILLPLLESLITATELANTTPTNANESGLQALRLACGRFHRVAIVSDNSEVPIERFLKASQIQVDTVLGRVPSRPDLLKPNPERFKILTAEVRPSSVTLIGDSLFDAQLAHASGAKFIALAKSEKRGAEFRSMGVRFIVTSMQEVVVALEALPQAALGGPEDHEGLLTLTAPAPR